MNPIKSFPVAVPLRSRTTVGAEAAFVDTSVRCPVRGLELPLEECAECRRDAGRFVDVESGNAFICCEVEPETSPDPLLQSEICLVPEPENPANRTPVSEIMTTHVVCVSPDLPVRELERLLLETGISGVPVVDAEGRPIGMVSKTDLVRRHSRPPGLVGDFELVRDVMITLAFCLPANESVARAAALMAFETVHRVPVVGSRGQVIGLVSPLDILRWLARGSGYVMPNTAPRTDDPSLFDFSAPTMDSDLPFAD